MLNDWNIFDVSLIGPKHKVTQNPNQDCATSVHLKYCDILVVADGLGSHQYSHLGSRAICRAVVKVCKMLDNHIENFNANYLLKLVHTTWLMLLQNQLIHQCGTTCLICIRTKCKIHIFTLGDGLVAVLDKGHNCHLLIGEDKEFGNITNAVNENFNEQDWKVFEYCSEKILMVMLCTDGIADDIMIDKREHWVHDFYEHYKNHTSKQIANDIRKWLKNWSVKNHHDDKTIACLIYNTSRGEM